MRESERSLDVVSSVNEDAGEGRGFATLAGGIGEVVAAAVDVEAVVIVEVAELGVGAENAGAGGRSGEGADRRDEELLQVGESWHTRPRWIDHLYAIHSK